MSRKLDPRRSIKRSLMTSPRRKSRSREAVTEVAAEVVVETTSFIMVRDPRHLLERGVEPSLTTREERRVLTVITRENKRMVLTIGNALPRRTLTPTHGYISSFMDQDPHSSRLLSLLTPKYLPSLTSHSASRNPARKSTRRK